MYRIRVAWKSGGVSSGETQHYESLESLVIDLLSHEISVRNHSQRGRMSLGDRLISFWNTVRRGGFWAERDTTNIGAVERLVDGEWVPLEYEFVPPALKIDGIVVVTA